MIEISEKTFIELLNKINELEKKNSPMSIQSKRLRECAAVLPLNGDKESNWYAYYDALESFEKLAHGIHYNTISSRLDSRLFEKEGKFFSKRSPRFLSDEEFDVSLQLFNELCEVYNKYYRYIHGDSSYGFRKTDDDE